jgi:acetyl-CoA acetyltransferase
MAGGKSREGGTTASTPLQLLTVRVRVNRCTSSLITPSVVIVVFDSGRAAGGGPAHFACVWPRIPRKLAKKLVETICMDPYISTCAAALQLAKGNASISSIGGIESMHACLHL